MLLIDDRAGSRDLIKQPPLAALAEAGTASLSRLDSADVAMSGNGPDGPLLVGVEVKSLSDLLSSIANGRLQATQIPAMIATYRVSWLAYYGYYRPGTDGELLIGRGKQWTTYSQGRRPLPYCYLENLLFDLADLGVLVHHAYSVSDLAHWLACLYRRWSKPWDRHRGLHTFDRSQDVPRQGMDDRTYLRAEVAARLPGLGFRRAIAAAAHFPSVTAMVNADVKEWESIDGIGRVIAKSVVRSLK